MVNSLAVAPRRLIVPEGGSNRLLDQFAKKGIEWKAIPYKAIHLNGGGIHCSTTPLIRDPV
jgi:arginine deiminase